MKYHDTHVHLNLLWQKLGGNLPDISEIYFDPDSAWPTDSDIQAAQNCVWPLLSRHDFVIQSTVSTADFAYNQSLWIPKDSAYSHPKIFLLLGSHPEMVKSTFNLERYLSNQQDFLDLLIQTHQGLPHWLVGVGECGLDYFYDSDSTTKRIQRALFESQIQLALKWNLPLVIHCREAFEDLFPILQDYPDIHGRFLVHCFTKGPKELEQIQVYGGKVGIGGILTFNSATYLHQAVTIADPKSILLETDLPYLAPTPHRGSICLPEYVDLVANRVAQLRQISSDLVWQTSCENTLAFFDLPSPLNYI